MQQNFKRMIASIERLGAAVDAMHQENAAARRNLMVFRHRLDMAENAVAGIALTLSKTVDALAAADGDARHAADVFRASAEGCPAKG